LQQHLLELAHEIERMVAPIPHYLTTVAGIGPVVAGSILGEIGDDRRFKNAKALVAYAGLDPRVHQSGAFIGKRAHLSKRGSTYLRRVLWIAAMAATRNDPGFKALLEQKLKQGKHDQVAMGAVANKLVHVLYAVLRDG
jgi:transposase